MAALSVACAAIASAGFIARDLIHPDTHLILFGGIVPEVVILFGLVAWVLAVNKLNNGIQNSVWPEEQVESLRKIIDSAFLKLIALALIVALIALFALTQQTHRSGLWAALVLSQGYTQLKFATQRRLPTSTVYRHRPIITGELKPLQSEHWGKC